jgi:glycosyltransferase involved in cell wall biosynthesis
MSRDPLISVVIPTYNRENSILYCLRSVLAQTYNDLEVIVVDDCSTDKTVSVIKNNHDSRVRCIVLEKNSGAQAARNRGIKEAKGQWIAFQDSDDEWVLTKLEKQIAALADADYSPRVFIYSNGFIFDTTKGRKRIWPLPVVEGENQYATLLQSPGPLFQGMLVSKEALDKIGYLDEAVPSFQEWDTSIRLSRCCRVIHIKEPLFVYHKGGSDTISGNRRKHVEGWYYIISKYEADIKEFCGDEAWQRINLQLLYRCLNFGLPEYYDRYLSRMDLSIIDPLHLSYLTLCRKWQVKPENIIHRISRKFFPRIRY